MLRPVDGNLGEVEPDQAVVGGQSLEKIRCGYEGKTSDLCDGCGGPRCKFRVGVEAGADGSATDGELVQVRQS